MKERYANLHNHTSASLLDACIRIPDLFKRIIELNQTSIAITDHGNCANLWHCWKEMKKCRAAGHDIKFIPGCELYYVDGDISDRKAKRRHLVVLASNHEGYKNLLRLNAAGAQNAIQILGRDFPRVNEEILRKHSEGLFATSACGGNLIAAHIFGGNRDAALSAAALFKDIFGDRFFIELQPHSLRRGEYSQEYLNEQLKSIAEELGIEMVATCDSHYLTARHEKYHDMILAISDKKTLDDPERHRYNTFEPCIACAGKGILDGATEPCVECMGTKGRSKPCPEFYLKSEQQIFEYFNKRWGADFANKLIDNTRKIADACEPPDYMEPKGVRLPTFGWNHIDQAEDVAEFKQWLKGKTKIAAGPVDWAYMRFRAWKEFGVFTKGFTKEKKDIYWKRVLFETEILESQNFCSYMLIVSDFMIWARRNGVETGVGRGSCAASLLGYFLKIHQVDPIQYDFFFERFQNRERKSPPDCDLDISPRHREKLIEYISKKYGEGCVAHISNINTITPKIAIKDITRSLNIGGDKTAAFKLANDITATIPDKVQEEEKIIKVDTMDKALKYSKELRTFVMQYPEVLEYANEIVGLPRSAGVHAAGIIISDIPLNEYVPLRADKEGRPVIQWDKDQCEEAGLIKFDLLGLDTLDVLRDTYDMGTAIGIKLPDPYDIPYDDQNAFNLIQSGKVVGVFQLEGDTLAQLCKPFKPASVRDIADLSALGRPGCSKEERKEFMDRRHGRKPPSFQHKVLEAVFGDTYGIKVYDEQLIMMGRVVGGWSLAKADVLRKITKLKEKGRDLLEKTKSGFIEDTMKHSSVSLEDAEMLWRDVVEPSSKYNFSLVHAVSYGVIGYRTAYYKYYAPAPFLAAKLNAETAKTTAKEDDIEIIKKDAKSFGIGIVPCDINVSKKYYAVKDRKTIVMGFSAIKGLGEKALEALILHQPYSSFEDFLQRTPSNAVNKGIIIALAKAGAFDSFGIGRKYASEHYAEIRKEMLAHIKKLPDSMLLLDQEGKPAKGEPAPGWLDGFSYSNRDKSKDEWADREKLVYEKEVLGEYVSGSADVLFPGFFKGGMYGLPYNRIQAMPEGSSYYLEGLVNSIREIIIKKAGKNQGKTMAKLVVENLKGETAELTLWPDMYQKNKKILREGVPIRGLTKVNDFNGSKSLIMANLEEVFKGSMK